MVVPVPLAQVGAVVLALLVMQAMVVHSAAAVMAEVVAAQVHRQVVQPTVAVVLAYTVLGQTD
jgi:hypothetical protein